MNRALSITCLVGCCLAGWTASARTAPDPDPVIAFGYLAAGERVEVLFVSTGCFHHEAHVFDIATDGTGTFIARVARVEPRRDEPSGRFEEVKRIPLGTVTLSNPEIAGLDRLFSFYRSVPDGGCTTIDEITATRMRGNTVLATETFTDETCATYDRKELTLLTDIAAKLQPGGR